MYTFVEELTSGSMQFFQSNSTLPVMEQLFTIDPGCLESMEYRTRTCVKLWWTPPSTVRTSRSHKCYLFILLRVWLTMFVKLKAWLSGCVSIDGTSCLGSVSAALWGSLSETRRRDPMNRSTRDPKGSPAHGRTRLTTPDWTSDGWAGLLGIPK